MLNTLGADSVCRVVGCGSEHAQEDRPSSSCRICRSRTSCLDVLAVGLQQLETYETWNGEHP